MTKTKWNNELVSKIIDDVAKGWRVLAVAVPTRAFRIIVDDLGLTFRVEQLDTSQNKQGIFKWRVISSHKGDEHYESYPSAIKAMLTAQVKFKELIKLSAHNEKMAQIRANAPVRTAL